MKIERGSTLRRPFRWLGRRIGWKSRPPGQQGETQRPIGPGVRFAGKQTQGARERQEDDFGFIEGSTIIATGAHPVAIVADGMGGHAAGDVASATAVRNFIDAYGTEGPAVERLRTALESANDALREAWQRDRRLSGMGTTLVAASVTDEGLYWISVGDSPLYLYRNGSLERLNEDHSMRPVIAAIAKEDEDLAMSYSPNQLRSVVMGEEIAKTDVRKEPLPLYSGDVVLAMTDGIETIDEGETADIVTKTRVAGPEAICDALLAAVAEKQEPRQDNTTVVVLNFEGEEAMSRERELPPHTETGGEAESPTIPDPLPTTTAAAEEPGDTHESADEGSTPVQVESEAAGTEPENPKPPATSGDGMAPSPASLERPSQADASATTDQRMQASRGTLRADQQPERSESSSADESADSEAPSPSSQDLRFHPNDA